MNWFNPFSTLRQYIVPFDQSERLIDSKNYIDQSKLTIKSVSTNQERPHQCIDAWDYIKSYFHQAPNVSTLTDFSSFGYPFDTRRQYIDVWGLM